jgi:hypothetical protein
MKGKFFKCNCGGEGLWVGHDHEFGTKFSLFETDPQNRSFKNRLILAWQCLRGKPYTDMVLLDDQSLADLVDQLVDIQNRDHAEENYKETVSAAADRLCGLSCGTAVDSIIEYVKRSDCSSAQLNRLISDLNKL